MKRSKPTNPIREQQQHGWVIPNKSGIVARCGGPAICQVCRQEYLNATDEQKKAYLDKTSIEHGENITEEDLIQKLDESIKVENRDNIAALEGKRAWRNQIPLTKNPYPKSDSAHLAWQHSWLAAEYSYSKSSPEGI